MRRSREEGDDLEYRRLRRSDLSVSAFGLGATTFGGHTAVATEVAGPGNAAGDMRHIRAIDVIHDASPNSK